jgi:riboflavin kinase / FMN adenylyltransferase
MRSGCQRVERAVRIVTDLSALERDRPAILTIGAFDGVHRGHQYLIREVVDRARRRDYAAVVITFDPRPQVVLRPGSKQLTDGEQKARIIKALGPDVLVILPFSRELAAVPAGQFLLAVLEHINLAEIWIGADFAFGHNREGTVDFLIRSGQRSGFGMHVVARQQFDGVPISSTAVRTLLEEGDVSAAARLLGHYFRVPGTVVRGAGRGVELGFPTANLTTEATQQVPATGIYAGFLELEGVRRPAAISVGYNPQFDGTELSVEAYVLDFAGDLYGQAVCLDFVGRVREERRFESVEGLIAAMGKDVAAVRAILGEAQEPGELVALGG